MSAMVASQAVDGALHSSASSVQDVCVDHGRLDVLVPQELLNSPDVVAIHQEMGREGVPIMPNSA